jgi:molybdenum cofactor cytidylyltransferase
MIWGVILAAGESRRMGRPKLLLPFGGATIVESVVRDMIASRVDKIVVVLGAHRQGIEDKIKGSGVEIALNPRFREGMLSSVHAGLGALPSSARAMVIALADQPGIPPLVIDGLIEAYHREKKGIVVPVYRKGRGHPFLIDLKYRPEIMALDPKVGLRGLLRKHPEDIVEVRVSHPAVLSDIDDPEDYARAIQNAARKTRSAPPTRRF